MSQHLGDLSDVSEAQGVVDLPARAAKPPRNSPGASTRLLTPAALVALMATAHAAIFSYLSLSRHGAFWTGRTDLGNMVQAVWSTANGRLLETTDTVGIQFSRIGAHADLLLLVFVPFTWSGFLPEALLISQALLVAAGAFPVYWLAQRWIGDQRLALAMVAAYLLYPPLQWAVLTDFHPVTLATPLLLIAIWAAATRRWVLLFAASGLAALSKEQVGVALIGLALLMMTDRSRRRQGVALGALAFIWVVVATQILIPNANPSSRLVFLDARYAHLGSDPLDLVSGFFTRPTAALGALADPSVVGYLLALLLPLMMLPLAAPLLVVPALPELALNVLSSDEAQSSVQYHYTAVIAPFMIAAGCRGLGRLSRLQGPSFSRALFRRRTLVSVMIVGSGLISGVVLGPLPWWSVVPGGSTVRSDTYWGDGRLSTMQQAVSMVPPNARVSASNLLGGHLSERRYIYTFPIVKDAEWVVVDRARVFNDVGTAEQYASVLDRLTTDDSYTIRMDRDGIVVLQRRATG